MVPIKCNTHMAPNMWLVYKRKALQGGVKFTRNIRKCPHSRTLPLTRCDSQPFSNLVQGLQTTQRFSRRLVLLGLNHTRPFSPAKLSRFLLAAPDIGSCLIRPCAPNFILLRWGHITNFKRRGIGVRQQIIGYNWTHMRTLRLWGRQAGFNKRNMSKTAVNICLRQDLRSRRLSLCSSLCSVCLTHRCVRRYNYFVNGCFMR